MPRGSLCNDVWFVSCTVDVKNGPRHRKTAVETNIWACEHKVRCIYIGFCVCVLVIKSCFKGKRRRIAQSLPFIHKICVPAVVFSGPGRPDRPNKHVGDDRQTAPRLLIRLFHSCVCNVDVWEQQTENSCKRWIKGGDVRQTAEQEMEEEAEVDKEVKCIHKA